MPVPAPEYKDAQITLYSNSSHRRHNDAYRNLPQRICPGALSQAYTVQLHSSEPQSAHCRLGKPSATPHFAHLPTQATPSDIRVYAAEYIAVRI